MNWVFLLMGCQLKEPEAKAPSEADAIAAYSKQPSYLQPIYPKPMPEGLTELSSASCGSCHTEIYEEWSASTHAYAWKDLQFQAELHKPTQNGGNVEWMCVRCHTPYWDQLSQLVVDTSQGLDFASTIPNPSFNVQLREEGIGCISCHLGEGVILGPTGAVDAPHPVQKSDELLGPEVCNNCHQAEAYFPEQNLACVFSTGTEHAASPQGQAGQSCQSCHMPIAERPAATGGPIRTTRRHYFGGSRIPKSAEHVEGVEKMAPYYQHGLHIDVVPYDAAVPLIQVWYENANAGHMLPAGDPERFILIRVVVSNEEGEVVDTQEVKIGTVYQWHPTVKRMSDNRLAPKEKRSIEIDLSQYSSGAYQLSVEAEKWRITEENLAYHKLEGLVPPKVTFFKKHENITIP